MRSKRQTANLLLLSMSLLLAGRPPTALAQSENLLQNPGFEGGFFAWAGINEIQVAHGWTPWWSEQPDRDPPYFRPEYKRALVYEFSNRVLAGESAQQWFTFHASHLAGMYQQVFNVTPGQTYRFSIWAQVWSSIEDDPHQSVGPANPRLRVGIDPTGNWSPSATTIVWSGEAPMSSHIDRWGLITVDAVAQNQTITVFMRTNPDFANKHNNVYWDEASLVQVGPPPPTPPPPTNTPDPAAPTNTPTLPAETLSPSATATSLPPTSTPSPEPTATATPVTTATATPEPTATTTAAPDPTATDTPEATAVADIAPTVTPEPTTAVSTPEPEPEPQPRQFPFWPYFLIGGIGLGLVLLLIFLRRR